MAEPQKVFRVYTRKHGILANVTREQADDFVKNNALDDYTIFDGTGKAVEKGTKGDGLHPIK